MAVRSVTDYRQHKIASIITDDLEKVIPMVDIMIKQLTNFAHYTPVKKILSEMQMNFHLLKAHHNKYKRIKEETKPRG